ncbi:MAG TPA: SPFH domain-containing protein [Candidatus Limnocylindrales bacterium]|nr:SPFH domain-containing protein [Candidatus Limnocylindrales bacterium]
MVIGVCDVPANERWIVEWLGRYHRLLPPGRHLIVPGLDSVTARIPVDQQVMAWSEHGLALAVRGSLRFTVVDPVKAAGSHVDGWPGLRSTMRWLAMDTMQSLARTMDDGARPGELAERAHALMRPVAAQWGIAVDEVTIGEIEVHGEPLRLRNSAPPLTGRQAAALVKPVQSAARLALARVVITLLNLTVLVVFFIAGSTDPIVCTDTAPCRPDPLGYLALGAMAAASFAAWIEVWAAVLGTSVLVLVLVITASSELLTLYLGYATLTFLMALFAHRPVSRSAAVEWGDRAHRRTLPETTGRAGQSRTWWVSALLLVAVGFAAAGLWQQDQANRRTAAAETTAATVESHDGDYAIVLRLGDSTVSIPVLSSANYPVGERIQVKLDNRGLLRPLAEPKDDSGWFLGAGLAGVVGAGLLLRRSRRNLAWWRLRRTAQPVSAVWYSPLFRAVYPSDVGEGDPPLAILANPSLLTVPGTAGPDSPQARSAMLFGTPAMGAYCAVVPDGAGTVVFGQLAQPPPEARWP